MQHDNSHGIWHNVRCVLEMTIATPALRKHKRKQATDPCQNQK